MRFLTAISVGMVALVSACGQPMMGSMAPAARPMVGAQSTKVVKSTAKALLLASFATLDRSGDKALDPTEFVPAATALPFALVDADKNGAVSPEEFTSDAAVNSFGKALRALAAGVGRALDADKDKKVSGDEFLGAFAKTDPAAVGMAKVAFDRADRNHDGKLAASEFEDVYLGIYAHGQVAFMPGPAAPAPRPAKPKPPAPGTPAPGTPAPGAPDPGAPAPAAPAPAAG